MSKWKPISEAPRNRSIILCSWWVGYEKAHPFICEGYLDWDGVAWRRAEGSIWDESRHSLPTHWQDLPKAPKSPNTILADNGAPDALNVLTAKLGIATGRNEMLAKALQASVDIMKSYRYMGYGDEVYMDTLCQAIREGERALSLHVTDTPRKTRAGE